MSRPRRPNPRRIETIARAFPAKLREARGQHNLTIQAAAELLGVSKQTVIAWERGLSLPGYRQLLRIL